MSNLHPTFANILDVWQSASRVSQLPRANQTRHGNSREKSAGMPIANLKGMKRDHHPGEKCFVVEYHGQNRATFECRQGHRFTRQMFPRAPNGKFPAEALLVKFARYWGPGTGCYMACPRCHR